MSEFLVLQHIGCEDLGTLANVMSQKGIGYRYVRLFDGEPVPSEYGKYSGIIILGGPMNVYEEDKYPYLKDEDLLIKKAMKKDLPLLGICLGGQLIAKAAGAQVSKGKKKEIGWYNLHLTEESRRDRIFNVLPHDMNVFQWHGDTFDIPEGAVRLAGSELFSNQAFRIGNRIYGLQFHLEVSEEMINQWVSEYWEELSTLKYINPDQIISDTAESINKLTRYAELFFEQFLDLN